MMALNHKGIGATCDRWIAWHWAKGGKKFLWPVPATFDLLWVDQVAAFALLYVPIFSRLAQSECIVCQRLPETIAVRKGSNTVIPFNTSDAITPRVIPLVIGCRLTGSELAGWATASGGEAPGLWADPQKMPRNFGWKGASLVPSQGKATTVHNYSDANWFQVDADILRHCSVNITKQLQISVARG